MILVGVHKAFTKDKVVYALLKDVTQFCCQIRERSKFMGGKKEINMKFVSVCLFNMQ